MWGSRRINGNECEIVYPEGYESPPAREEHGLWEQSAPGPSCTATFTLEDLREARARIVGTPEQREARRADAVRIWQQGMDRIAHMVSRFIVEDRLTIALKRHYRKRLREEMSCSSRSLDPKRLPS